MRDLQRELRKLDKDDFESFVHQYLVACYPSAGIKRVEGSGGDAGIDNFEGQLGSGPAIWQSKHFPDRIRKPQQKQILKSIKAAFKNSPTLWTLCLPIDLRTTEHKWFQQKIVNEYGGPERIKLVGAADFVRELLHNRPLRDAFFPDNTLSNIMDLRKIVTQTETSSERQLSALTSEYAQQYLERGENLDPRLKAVISIGGTPEMRRAQQQAGLVFSFSESEHTTNYFARDIKAFNLDPIKFQISLPSEQGKALNAAIDAGDNFRAPAGNLLRLETSSPLLNELFGRTELSQLEFSVSPRVPEEIASKIMPLRLKSGSGSSAKILSYVPFKVTKTGRRQITLVSQGQLPLAVQLICNRSIEGGATINLRPVLPGSDVHKLQQVVEFMEELERSSEFQIDNVETDSPLIRASGVEMRSDLGIPQWLKNVISDAAIVAAAFKVPLCLPQSIADEDKIQLKTLKRIATGEQFFDADWEAVLTKAEQHQKNAIKGFRQEGFVMRIDHPAGWRNFRVFGETIDPGPVTIIGYGTKFQDVENTISAYVSAQEGEGIPIQAHCDGPCHFERNAWNPYSAVLIDAGQSVNQSTR